MSTDTSESGSPSSKVVIKSHSVTVSKPLLKLKLLDALRQGNFQQLQALLNSSQFQPSDNEIVLEVTELMLNYAVQVAPLPLIKDIVKYYVDEKGLLDINQKDANGNTPLHLAAYQSRTDAVAYLMDHPKINDCIANNSHLQPVEMCKNLNTAQMMQFKRSNYVAEIAQEFRTAFNNRDFGHLESILSNNRNAELLDINGMDPETGDTVLHEFVKKRDVIMCRWLLEHGADPFKRDSKGKLPIDLVRKVNENDSASNTRIAIDIELKKLLERATKEQTVIDITNNNLHEAPTFKGYLKKWTNFAQGYKLRWFILSEDGKLSYYVDQADTNNACRGSLNMSSCNLHLDSSEKLKFEIIGGTNGSIRWHLKGNHPIETSRWVWAIQGAIRFAKDRELQLRNNGGAPPSRNMDLSESNLPRIRSFESLRPASTPVADNANDRSLEHTMHDEKSNVEPLPQLSSAVSTGKIRGRSRKSTISSSVSGIINEEEFQMLDKQFTEENSDLDEDDAEDDDDNEVYTVNTNNDEEDLKVNYGPYSQKLHMLQRSISIELSSLTELLSDDSGHVSSEMWQTINKSISTISSCFTKLNYFTSARDKRLLQMLTKQRDVNNVWIQSVKDLEMELIDKDERLASLDKERKHLKKMLQRELHEAGTLTPSNKVNTKSADVEDESLLELTNNGGDESPINTLEEIAKYINATKEDDEDSDIDEFFDAEDVVESSVLKEANFAVEETNTENPDEEVNEISPIAEEVKQQEETDQNLQYGPNIKIVTESQEQKNEILVKEGTFLGYEDGVRTRLALDQDDRPKVSLWSVLKSMVGKDMTKMTLPVTFNEPTSLLQRVTEDLEYSTLLDQAATFEDSTLRLLYTATFASSIYASTIGRVAKPFNPLLGETFEYTNPNGSYRFFTEQVSHHPPIAATWTESPKWDFFGEVNVVTSFNGRSFGIKHLGLWHVKIRPDSGAEEDLYTYKKPDNTVIGILVGNPQVDNHGEVTITNHTTGDYCNLTFKARGWTSTGAFELKGDVYNKKGEKVWVLGGHWNDAIYAKKVTSKNKGDLKVEGLKTTKATTGGANMISNTTGDEGPKYDGSKFLLWKVNGRDMTVPFHLTPFAITLNAPQPHLLPWLAPTDSRLRPDQRAMEDGRYDEAADEKHRLEEKQRAVRRNREMKGEGYKPRWFKEEIHPITRQPYWKSTGEYWALRKEHKLKDCGDIF
ncbi:hypothetical protein NCAS_0C03680 [Naumovozyma castellii]|uniref:PH domain-containing protein n=1 Tax=Naumovozyma castellii TaxID=27288 RepID=G0VCZ7_NAUCA|nr:hypothetical protein NCAS_0C03680 [Naumovozyma castellii CBS 4309]CCC69358.1 hypothetical protein NCAS_0C03680 [Naumovozyma castellii CBS 4309]